jgi:hypothetical protein
MCLVSCAWPLWLAVFVQWLISFKGKKMSELIHNLKWLMKSNCQLVPEQIPFLKKKINKGCELLPNISLSKNKVE